MTNGEIEALARLNARRERDETLQKISLTLLHQCKAEGLTVAEVKAVCDKAVLMAERTTLHDGLVLQASQDFGS